MGESVVRVAAAQYPIEFLESWARYRDKISHLVAEAAESGARLAVFPEYASMELASLFPREVYSSLSLQLERMQDLLPQYRTLFAELARRHDLYVCAGSFPERVGDEYRNRSYFFSPEGRFDFQEKLVMTRFENERWLVRKGKGIRVFETRCGRVGINVCYDVEFPLVARAQAEAGADLIVVPSCTDTLAGYHRVRLGCQARALENQCFVVMSPTVGQAPWSEAVDVNVGAAGMFAPPDLGMPDDGVLAVGELNAPQWVYADLDLDAVRRVRREGQVFNARDWDNQCAAVAAAQLCLL
ncbi:MAG TPA: carbon-nitrogen hydrolase family protein [Burkholderiales bacterium]|nr:carbon-nitrogen hydrolase family protein [Burkholderiales bacterium]